MILLNICICLCLYFLFYKLFPDQPGFRNCAGLSYPGTVFGGAPTWNEYGVYATQNTLHLRSLRQDGLACTLVQRGANCEACNMDEAVAGLDIPEWVSGASMNLVDVRGKRMANIEIWENLSHAQEVTETPHGVRRQSCCLEHPADNKTFESELGLNICFVIAFIIRQMLHCCPFLTNKNKQSHLDACGLSSNSLHGRLTCK